MPIKWNITAKATEARSHMDAISRAYDKLNENARSHRVDVEGLASQVDDMQTDLEHAANVMGNGPGASDEASASNHPGAQLNALQASPSPPEVGQPNTFHVEQ